MHWLQSAGAQPGITRRCYIGLYPHTGSSTSQRMPSFYPVQAAGVYTSSVHKPKVHDCLCIRFNTRGDGGGWWMRLVTSPYTPAFDVMNTFIIMPWLHVKQNYFKIISEVYCSSWIFSNMFNVAEIILEWPFSGWNNYSIPVSDVVTCEIKRWNNFQKHNQNNFISRITTQFNGRRFNT